MIGEVILPRRVVPQPIPELHTGGDCGACVLAGLLGLPIADVYSRYGRQREDSTANAFSWPEMNKALWKAAADGFLDRHIEDVPVWIGNAKDCFMNWGFPSWQQNLAWFNYVRMAVDAGYYGIASISHGRRGPIDGYGDHWVLIVGARRREEEREHGRAIEHELLVSCSSTTTPDEEWVIERDFLRERGGFNLLLARPAP